MLFTISTWILLMKIRQYGNKLQIYFESYSMGSYIIWLDDSIKTLQRTCNKFLFCVDNKNKVDAKTQLTKNFMCWHVYIYFSQYSQNLTSCSNSNNPDPSNKRWWILYTLLGWMGNTCKTAVNWFFKIIHSFLLRIWINEFTACFLLYSNIYIAPHCHVGYQGKICK